MGPGFRLRRGEPTLTREGRQFDLHCTDIAAINTTVLPLESPARLRVSLVVQGSPIPPRSHRNFELGVNVARAMNERTCREVEIAVKPDKVRPMGGDQGRTTFGRGKSGPIQAYPLLSRRGRAQAHRTQQEPNSGGSDQEARGVAAHYMPQVTEQHVSNFVILHVRGS